MQQEDDEDLRHLLIQRADTGDPYRLSSTRGGRPQQAEAEVGLHRFGLRVVGVDGGSARVLWILPGVKPLLVTTRTTLFSLDDFLMIR